MVAASASLGFDLAVDIRLHLSVSSLLDDGAVTNTAADEDARSL